MLGPVSMLVLGILVGGICSLLWSRVRLNAGAEQINSLRAQLIKDLTERDVARADLAAFRQELESERKTANEALTRLRGELGDTRTALATAEATLKAEQLAHQGRLVELRVIEQRIDERVKSAASDALRNTTPQLIALARSELGKERAETRREVDVEHRRITDLFSTVDKSLTRVAGKLGEIERDRIEGREELAAQLRVMRESQAEMSAGTQALVGALRRPHIRGRWGEVQLRNIVEAAGMLPHIDFDEQPALANEERLLRPDACVHLPGQRDVPIDAKVPLEAYLGRSATGCGRCPSAGCGVGRDDRENPSIPQRVDELHLLGGVAAPRSAGTTGRSPAGTGGPCRSA